MKVEATPGVDLAEGPPLGSLLLAEMARCRAAEGQPMALTPLPLAESPDLPWFRSVFRLSRLPATTLGVPLQ